MSRPRAITTGVWCFDWKRPWLYSDSATLAAAEHAVAVYRKPADYGLHARRAGFDGGTVIERGPAQIGLAWKDAMLVISPRGTSELGDWIHDALSVVKVRPAAWWRDVAPDDVRVGWGFQRQASALVETLREYLEFASSPGGVKRKLSVVITGHSLGAALVPFVVVALSRIGITPIAAWAFSSPRTGNAAWSRFYSRTYQLHTPTWSVVNVSRGCVDPITRVPRKRWGFRHLGARVIITGQPRDEGPGPQIVFGDDAWADYRKKNPISSPAAWRIITRAVTGARAHYGDSLLRALRDRVAP